MYAHTLRGHLAIKRGLEFQRRIRRARLTPGALYLDTVMRYALEDRMTGGALELRLLVASDIADQLDAA